MKIENGEALYYNFYWRHKGEDEWRPYARNVQMEELDTFIEAVAQRRALGPAREFTMTLAKETELSLDHFIAISAAKKKKSP